MKQLNHTNCQKNTKNKKKKEAKENNDNVIIDNPSSKVAGFNFNPSHEILTTMHQLTEL